MEAHHLIFAASIALLAARMLLQLAAGRTSPLGTNCKSQTSGLMFLQPPRCDLRAAARSLRRPMSPRAASSRRLRNEACYRGSRV